jgi:hypothetical protein
MIPFISARNFYNGLKTVAGREMLPVATSADIHEECIAMWQKPVAYNSADAVKGIWDKAEASVKESCRKFSPDSKTFSIKVPMQDVSSNGFKINGMELYFPKGLKVGVELTYAVEKGRKFSLKSATYDFSAPVLGYCNFIVSLGDVFKNGLSEKGIARIMENLKVEPYDKSAAGLLTRPMVFAFDKLDVSEGKISLRIRSREYTKNGWGIFSFGSSKKDCVSANTEEDPSFFLGDGFGGEGSEDECRSTLVGPRFGKPLMKWMMKVKDWKALYDGYMKDSGNDKVLSLTAVVNFALGTGIASPRQGYDKVAKEEGLLGSGFNIWKENSK